MSFPRSNEPIMVTIAVYTLRILNQIKNGEKTLPQEWVYLESAPVHFLNELLAYAGFGFTPVVKMGDFEKEKETDELDWQFQNASAALKKTGVFSDSQDRDERHRNTVKALSLFIFVIKKTLKCREYPREEGYQKIIEQYRQFLFFLCESAMGYQTAEMREIIAAA